MLWITDPVNEVKPNHNTAPCLCCPSHATQFLKLTHVFTVPPCTGEDVDFLRTTSFGLLQGSRMRNTKTEYVSCPSCGRTLFNLQEVRHLVLVPGTLN